MGRDRRPRRWASSLAAVLAAISITAVLGVPPVAAEPSPQDEASVVRPVVVLLDTSASMNDDDGSGTVKLTGAKRAIGDIVRGLSSSTIFGVWSYPLGASCNPGRFVSPPTSLSDRTGVIQSVDQLIAVGDTPTGLALRAVADALAQDFAGATVVVISDGETTCGPPPCDVAEDIVAEGFDVKVPTVAFNTSEAGEDELRCIAAATGSEAFTADDSDALAATLDDLLSPRLSVGVEYDTAPVSGSSTRITATVEQGGGSSAENVQLSLGFLGPETQRLPAAIPPVVSLGNLPPGENRTYSWVVATGAPSTSTDVAFRVAAWAGNATRAITEGLYTTTAQEDDEFGSILDGVDAEHPIAIFGDSYSSGEGAGSYAVTPLYAKTACHRSSRTYLTSIVGAGGVANFACSGATVSAAIGTSDSTTQSQVNQFFDSGVVPGAAALTFGGNDVGFANIILQCTFFTCATRGILENKMKEIDDLDLRLSEAYLDIWSAVNRPDLRAQRDGAYAPLLVLAYPKVTTDPRFGGCAVFNPQEVIVAELLAARLNAVAAAAVARVRDSGYEVYFVDSTQDAMRPDHTVCSSDPWINRVAMDAHELMHPNANGYAAESARIAAWSRTATTITPTVADQEIRDRIARFPAPATFGSQLIRLSHPGPPPRFDQNSFFRMTGPGFAPGSGATVTIHSAPIVLGTLEADETGHVDGELLLPHDIPLGAHELVVQGVAADGTAKTVTIPLSVVAPTPLWVVAAAVVAGVAAVAAFAAGASAWWVRRRRPDDPDPVGVEPVRS